MVTDEQLKMLELQSEEVLTIIDKVFDFLYNDSETGLIDNLISEMLSRTDTVIKGIQNGAVSNTLLVNTKAINERYKELEQLLTDQKTITASQLKRSQAIFHAMKGYNQDPETDQKNNPLYYDKKG